MTSTDALPEHTLDRSCTTSVTACKLESCPGAHTVQPTYPSEGPITNHFCLDLLALPVPPPLSPAPNTPNISAVPLPLPLPPRVRQTLQRMTKSDWHAQNRWFVRSVLDTKMAVLRRFAQYGVPTRNLEPQIIIDTLFDFLCICDSTQAEQCALLFDMTPHTYSGMLHRACNPQLSDDNLCRVVRTVLLSTWKILQEHLIFTRSHIVMLYERLRTLFLTWSAPKGSATFQALVGAVTDTFQPFKNTRQPAHLRAYRVTCLRRIHRVLITTVFNNLCYRGHFKDADVLFQHSRQQLVPLLKHWLPSLDHSDATAVWRDCVHIRTYCQQNVCRLDTLLVKCPVFWTRCKQHSGKSLLLDMLTAPECELAVRMCDCAALLQKPLMPLLQQFALYMQRRILRALVQWMCEKRTAELHAIKGPGDQPPEHLFGGVQQQLAESNACSTEQPAAQQSTGMEMGSAYQQNSSPQEMNDAINTLLCRNMRTLLRLAGMSHYLISFYLALGHRPEQVFGMVCPVWRCTPSHLRRWLQAQPSIPLCAYDQLTEHVAKLMDTTIRQTVWTSGGPPSPMEAEAMTETRHLRMAQILRQYDRQLHMLLQRPLDMSVSTLNAWATPAIRTVGRLVATYNAHIATAYMPGLVLLVKCLLMTYHMHYRTVVIPSHHDCTVDCAICYNAVQTPLRQLQCGHVFHTECMVQTVQLAMQSGFTTSTCLCKCPYCMQPVVMCPETQPPVGLQETELVDATKHAPLTEGREAYASLYRWWRHKVAVRSDSQGTGT